jgi:hypothetical protein
LGGGIGKDAKAAGKGTRVRGILRHQGEFLGAYTISEDGR